MSTEFSRETTIFIKIRHFQYSIRPIRTNSFLWCLSKPLAHNKQWLSFSRHPNTPKNPPPHWLGRAGKHFWGHSWACCMYTKEGNDRPNLIHRNRLIDRRCRFIQGKGILCRPFSFCFWKDSYILMCYTSWYGLDCFNKRFTSKSVHTTEYGH